MTRRAWNIDDGPLRGLYRDRENGWIYGVCAGIADRYNLQVFTVRLIAIISLVLFFWLTALVYVAAVMLIRQKPLIYSGRREEYEFWRRQRDSRDSWSGS